MNDKGVTRVSWQQRKGALDLSMSQGFLEDHRSDVSSRIRGKE